MTARHAAFSLLLLSACTPEKVPPEEEIPPPDYSAPGAWRAASAEVEIVGSTGVTLPVQIWYPTMDELEGNKIRYDDLLDGEAIADGSPDCPAPGPLVAFSHGSGGMRWQSPFFGEHLASHGWVVVAPDHTGNTFLDDSGSIEEIALRRPQDLADAVDWLFSENGAGGSYEGCVDAAAGYAVVGHSFGGYTTYAAAGAEVDWNGDMVDLSDPRVWAGVAWAPWDVGGAIVEGAASISVPMATLGGTLDDTTIWSTQLALYNALTVAPRALGEFPTAGHYSFSPVACTLAGLKGDGCGDAFIDLDLFVDLVNTSTLSFLAGANGDAAALEQLPDSPELLWTVVE